MSSPSGHIPAPSLRVISHERVLHYVYEFLDENGYRQSLRALQAESKVPYNTIHAAADASGSSPTAPAPASSSSGKKSLNHREFPRPTESGLAAAVMEGSWAEVLHVYVDGLLLPEEVKATLYEVILEEMVDLHGLLPAARTLLLNAPVFQCMKTDTPARYIRLEKMIEKGQHTVSEEGDSGLGGTSTARRVTAEMRQRRAALLNLLKAAIRFTPEAPVGRLPAALARAAAPALPSAREDTSMVSSGTAPVAPSKTPATAVSETRKRERSPELPGEAAWADTFLQYPLSAPKEIRRRLPYAGEQAATCCAPLQSATNELLLVGRVDGVVDIRRSDTGEVYGAVLRHTDGVLSLAQDMGAAVGWVAVGYRDGWVKVYNIESRKLVRRFERVHTMGVTTLFFTGPRTVEGLSGHQSLVVTGSFDGAIRVLDIAAGAVVCNVGGAHASAFIHALLLLSSSPADAHSSRFFFLSSGNDGTVTVWRLEDARAREGNPAVELHKVQEALPLGQVHGELRDAVPTQMHALPAVIDSTHVSTPRRADGVAEEEVLLLTRAGKACVCRVTVRADNGGYLSTTVQALCIIATKHPLRSAYAFTHYVVSLPVPLLTIYSADSEGTVSLHNVEMKWLNADQWAAFGGCMKVNAAADQSSVVIVEVGKAVKDLQLTCVWPQDLHQPTSVLAYSPSLPAVCDMV